LNFNHQKVGSCSKDIDDELPCPFENV